MSHSRSNIHSDFEISHFVIMGIGIFARKHGLTYREAGNYLLRYKGIEFAIKHYDVEHLLSLQQCVDDMTAICQANGGQIA